MPAASLYLVPYLSMASVAKVLQADRTHVDRGEAIPTQGLFGVTTHQVVKS